MGYGSRRVLEALDLDLPFGLTTSVVGPGGSGKTTLLRALAGAGLRPESMWVRGDLGAEDRAVLMLPQKSEPASCTRILEQIESLPPNSLLMLDEPFVDLDTGGQESLHRQLEEIRGRHTVLCVTHHLKHARRLSDHVVLLVDGVVVEASPVDDFFERPQQTRTADFLVTGS